jgi:hypothetical protein
MRYTVKDGVTAPHGANYYVYDIVKDQVVWQWSAQHLANQMCQDLNEIEERSGLHRTSVQPAVTGERVVHPRGCRYVTVETRGVRAWHVLDTMQGQLVWTDTDRDKAWKVEADLEAAHKANEKPHVVLEGVVERMKLDAAISDIRAVELFDVADAAREEGDSRREKEAETEGARLRLRSRDIYALLEAAGVSLKS